MKYGLMPRTKIDIQPENMNTEDRLLEESQELFVAKQIIKNKLKKLREQQDENKRKWKEHSSIKK
ncbi:hypothetical protein SAMN05443253_11540 [Bacillus sp. OK048]|nr:hypothetical protein SAMN05443253_11540 [Bacillus sp. OK048]